ncbi:hypothetical protein LUZ60_008076 [Juncus effusus]|nr:hypothetical protein LUZ60_008076 [Juncus effusus]
MRTSIHHLLLHSYHHHSSLHSHFNKQVVVIMGATGTGKTRLSIDMAHQFSGEVVNSDKIQLYAGLDITTNKVPVPDRRGVPHHLLGSVPASSGELPPESYRQMASATISSISARNKLPVIAGGSNSLIHALLSHPYQSNRPSHDPFAAQRTIFHRPGLRYQCHMLWVDVEEAVLMEYLDKRVDEMVQIGMIEELAEYFKKEKKERDSNVGLNRAIGVPELEHYFTGTKRLNQALEEIKENTRELAMVQVRKIEKMKNEWKWPIRRVDVTEVVRAKLRAEGKEVETDMWDQMVLRPCNQFVGDFLMDGDGREDGEEEERREIVGCAWSTVVQNTPKILKSGTMG